MPFTFEGRKRAKERIVEGNSVFVDGQRYTLYQIVDGDDEDEKYLRAEGVQKVNGGGITWRDARFECNKRGRHLAMIFTNEAATVVANAMLRNRPCKRRRATNRHFISLPIHWTERSNLLDEP